MFNIFKKKQGYLKNILCYYTNSIVEYGVIEDTLKFHNIPYTYELIENRAFVLVFVEKNITELSLSYQNTDFLFETYTKKLQKEYEIIITPEIEKTFNLK